MADRTSIIRKTLITGALVAGASFGAAGIAAAATSSSSSTTPSSSAPANGSSGSTAPAPGTYGAPSAGRPDPAAMRHGPNETPLTGSDLQKADAAARAAVPGATIIRAETDSSGAAKYEVHMKKSDGTEVTVQLDSNFKVVNTVSGLGPCPGGAHGPVQGNGAGSGVSTPSPQA